MNDAVKTMRYLGAVTSETKVRAKSKVDTWYKYTLYPIDLGLAKLRQWWYKENAKPNLPL